MEMNCSLRLFVKPGIFHASFNGYKNSVYAVTPKIFDMNTPNTYGWSLCSMIHGRRIPDPKRVGR